MQLRRIGALQGKLVVSFRGYDISRYVKQHGDDIYNQLFDAGDVFLPNCEYFRRRMVELGCDEKRALVHPSGIHFNRFKFNPPRMQPDGRLRLVTVGCLVEKKRGWSTASSLS